ncbi:MAG TPA: hypothetical protein VGE63_02955 [Candidatus Paceibacterota bacterium]
MNNKFYKKTIASLLVTTTLFAFVIGIINGTRFATAQSTSNSLSLDKYLPQIAALANTSNAMQKSNSLDLKVFDKIAFNLAQSFINKNLKSVVSWAYTGFDGKPSFIQNLELTYQNAQSKVFRQKLEEYATAEYASAYTKKILLGLISEYTGKSTNPSTNKINAFIRNNIQEKTKWTKFLTGVGYGNPTAQARKENLTGFWSKYQVLSKPSGNLFGEYFTTRESINKAIVANQQVVDKNLQLNNGFQGQQECLRLISKKKNKDIKIGDYTYDENGQQKPNFAIIPSNEDAADPNAIANARYAKPEECAVYATTLPGSLVESAFKKAADTPNEQAQNIDTWYELLSSTMTTLADELTKQGTSLGVNWARKTVAEGVDRAKIFTQEQIKKLLAEAPESYDSNEIYLSGQSIDEDLETTMTPEMEKCLKEAGLAKPFIDEINANIVQYNTGDFATLGDLYKLAPSNVQTYADLASIGQTCGFSKIALVKTQIEQLDIAARVIGEAIPYLRKLDICIPGPDKGWESRFATAYTTSRNALTARIAETSGGTLQKNADGTYQVPLYEQYAQRLDSGFNDINAYIEKKINNPVDMMSVRGGSSYKSLVDQADTIFTRKKEAEGLLSRYLKVYDRMVEIKSIWEQGTEPGTNLPIGPRYTLKLLQELESYSGYTETNAESEAQLAETLDFLTSVIKANKDCIKQRNANNYLNSRESALIYSAWKAINPNSELYSREILKRLNFDPTAPLPGEIPDVTFSPEQIAYLESYYGNGRNGIDAQVYYNELLKAGTIKVDSKLIDGSKDSISINASAISPANPESNDAKACRSLIAGAPWPWADETTPIDKAYFFRKETDGNGNEVYANQQYCEGIRDANGSGGTITTGVSGNYTSGGEYQTVRTTDNSAIDKAIMGLNIASLTQIANEAQDNEISYYCVAGYLAGDNAPYIAGLEFGKPPPELVRAAKADKIFDTVMGIQQVAANALGLGDLVGAFRDLKGALTDKFGISGKLDTARNPPNKYFQGFSCSKFYTTKSTADYDPSAYNLSY